MAGDRRQDRKRNKATAHSELVIAAMMLTMTASSRGSLEPARRACAGSGPRAGSGTRRSGSCSTAGASTCSSRSPRSSGAAGTLGAGSTN